jgi:hypothetical protein
LLLEIETEHRGVFLPFADNNPVMAATLAFAENQPIVRKGHWYIVWILSSTPVPPSLLLLVQTQGILVR